MLSTETRSSFFPESHPYRWLLLLIIFVAAFSVRSYNIDSPPLDYSQIRQYRSYLLARSLYYDSFGVAAQENDKVVAQAAKPALLEPPIMEYLTSFLYWIFGGENFILPRLVSILFWLTAGLILYLLAKDLVSPDGGVIAAVFFLFLPFGVRASRSFQPDSMMIMLYVASIYMVYQYYIRPSSGRLAVLCILSALAIFVKPVCLFPIFGAFFMMRIPTRDIRKVIFKPDIFIFGIVAILPTLLYYGYNFLHAGLIKHQVGFTFKPFLLQKPFFWHGWFRMISRVIGEWPIAVSLAGILLAGSELKKFFLIGLFAGYIVSGCFFTFHIHTHDYYQLILIPIVALSLAQVASVLLETLALNKGIWHHAVWFLLALSILFSIRESVLWLNDAGFDKQVKIYQEIGERVNHSTNTLMLDQHDGNGLMYHGRIARYEAWDWPLAYDLRFGVSIGVLHESAGERLKTWISEISPEYFIVSTVDELKEQQGLKEALDNGYLKIAETPDYVIYDLRHKKSNAQ